MLGDRVYRNIDIVLLDERQLDFAIQVQQDSYVDHGLAGLHTVLNVNQAFLQRLQALLGLLSKIF